VCQRDSEILWLAGRKVLKWKGKTTRGAVGSLKSWGESEQSTPRSNH